MPKRVLLYVEDEDAAVFLLETALKEARIQVDLYRVSDGEQAIAFLKHTPPYDWAPKPDLVLLDLNLPRKNGLEVLAEMKKNKVLSDIATVVFTSSALPSDKKKSLALGAQDYITKPSTFDGFIEAVRSACSPLAS
jgi:CheY-like chemotaxis protein